MSNPGWFKKGHQFYPEDPIKNPKEGVLCECGCGQVAKPGKIRIHGHQNVGRVIPEDVCRRRGLVLKGMKRTLDQRKNYQAAATRRWQDPEIAARLVESMVRVAAKRIGIPLTEAHRKAIGTKCREYWKDPIWAKEMSHKIASAIKSARPNRPEKKLLTILDNLYPREWKYVGDGTVWMGGKNPDFINVNGKKLIIEMFGDYWHRNDDPQDRAKVFEPFGFRTLVVWEKELGDKNLMNKLTEFIGRGR